MRLFPSAMATAGIKTRESSAAALSRARARARERNVPDYVNHARLIGDSSSGFHFFDLAMDVCVSFELSRGEKRDSRMSDFSSIDFSSYRCKHADF